MKHCSFLQSSLLLEQSLHSLPLLLPCCLLLKLHYLLLLHCSLCFSHFDLLSLGHSKIVLAPGPLHCCYLCLKDSLPTYLQTKSLSTRSQLKYHSLIDAFPNLSSVTALPLLQSLSIPFPYFIFLAVFTITWNDLTCVFVYCLTPSLVSNLHGRQDLVCLALCFSPST